MTGLRLEFQAPEGQAPVPIDSFVRLSGMEQAGDVLLAQGGTDPWFVVALPEIAGPIKGELIARVDRFPGWLQAAIERARPHGLLDNFGVRQNAWMQVQLDGENQR